MFHFVESLLRRRTLFGIGTPVRHIPSNRSTRNIGPWDVVSCVRYVNRLSEVYLKTEQLKKLEQGGIITACSGLVALRCVAFVDLTSFRAFLLPVAVPCFRLLASLASLSRVSWCYFSLICFCRAIFQDNPGRAAILDAIGQDL